MCNFLAGSHSLNTFVSLFMETEVVKVDVAQVIKDRLPGASRWLPRFVVRGLERLICQDGLNELLRNNAGTTGAGFCAGVLRDLDVKYTVEGVDQLPPANDHNVVYVSNHPLGALDGICIIDMVAKRHPGRQVKFIVNDLLMALKPLHDIFVPINKHGSQNRDTGNAVDAAFGGDGPVIVFPAGLCSRKRNGVVKDLDWHKMFVAKARQSGRKVIPLFFDAHNSRNFYNFARFREKTGLKFNLEMILLPREVFKCRGARFTIYAGKPIEASTLPAGAAATVKAAEIRDLVYSLKPNNTSNNRSKT